MKIAERPNFKTVLSEKQSIVNRVNSDEGNQVRPAFVFDNVRDAKLHGSAAARGAASTFDVGLRNGAAVDLAGSGGLEAKDEGAFEVRHNIKPPLHSGLDYPPYFFDTRRS